MKNNAWLFIKIKKKEGTGVYGNFGSSQGRNHWLSIFAVVCMHLFYFVFVNNQRHDENNTKLRKLFLRYKIPTTWANYSAGKEEPFTILSSSKTNLSF